MRRVRAPEAGPRRTEACRASDRCSFHCWPDPRTAAFFCQDSEICSPERPRRRRGARGAGASQLYRLSSKPIADQRDEAARRRHPPQHRRLPSRPARGGGRSDRRAPPPLGPERSRRGPPDQALQCGIRRPARERARAPLRTGRRTARVSGRARRTRRGARAAALAREARRVGTAIGADARTACDTRFSRAVTVRATTGRAASSSGDCPFQDARGSAHPAHLHASERRIDGERSPTGPGDVREEVAHLGRGEPGLLDRARGCRRLSARRS